MKDIFQLCVLESTMIKGMSFYSTMRTRHAYSWVSIIWFTSAVCIPVSEGVELQTIPQVVHRCGEKVTLKCDVTSSQQVDIISFEWLAPNESKTMCQYEDDKPDGEVVCESTKTPNHRLTLTLPNVMPVNQGSYSCKLRSKQGVKYAKTVVTVQDCYGHSNFSINKSHAKCWFSEVYPRGIIHWFQEKVNLTDSTSTQEEKDQHGWYNVLSTIGIEKRNGSLPYECSLWIPSVGKYLSSQVVPLTEELESSGNMVKLQWISVIVEIMMVKFML